MPIDTSDQLREEWIEITRNAIDAGNQAQCQTYYDQAVTELAQLGSDGAPEQTGDEQTQQAQAQPQTGEQVGTQTAQTEGGAQGCEALEALTAEEADRLREEWIAEAEQVIEAGDAAQCQALFDQASAELAPLDTGQQVQDGAAVAAEIVVVQPDAEVQVTQPPPEVTVTNPPPEVTVNQGQPQVLVRQAPPNVRVQVPQPIITIEQPPPEIIITMPDPQVAVTNPEPQVEVRQAQPTVRVEQPEPQVRVEQAEGGDGQADVQVQQSEEAQVLLTQPQSDPQVEVTQQEPVVTVEQAEPNVTVEQVGEAEVQFSQTGEPVITFQQGQGGVQNEDPTQDQPNAEGDLDAQQEVEVDQ
ncbi:hypothetical protein [Rubellimicrobium roseum]|uniref:Uncharacterized protein n=1 Tax=Rubellimicrobium roseum TaxID=687525 RepID=A0A5C4N4Z0_9RHOB|nr:hypothetical protein [Rubellimicrobium roseum]TNC60694.1 hypothetical protein FHG71_21795 [Rubellimicrobium roseum]